MKRGISALQCAAALLLFTCCHSPSEPSLSSYRFLIRPLLTRVTGTNFDRDDRIGVTVTTADGPYAENRELTYDGSCFTAEGFIWYNDLTKPSTVYAYSPYDAAGTPSRFTVSSDQTGAGFGQSDLLAAVRSSVTPSESAVEMVFDHLLSKVRIRIANTSSGRIERLTLGGTVAEASVDVPSKTAEAAAGAPAEIEPHTVSAESHYEAIVVPQDAALNITIHTDDGKTHVRNLEPTTLLPGRIYTVQLTLSNIDFTATFSGEVTDWIDGGTIGESDAPNGVSSDLVYGGDTYRTVELADGRVWMAENLRYNPGDATSLSTGSQGVRYPGETLRDEASVRRYGLLYTAEAALGSESLSEALSFQPIRGLCPDGWHVPTAAEFETLLSASEPFPLDFVGETPFLWNGLTNAYGAQTHCAWLWSSSPAAESYDGSLKALCAETSSAPLAPYLTRRQSTFGLPIRCIKNL